MMVPLVLLPVVLIVSVWLATTLMALILPARPDFIQIVRPFVCLPGSEMKVKTEQGARNQPGQKLIDVYCEGPHEDRRDVKVKALFVLWAISVTVSIPIVLVILLAVLR